MLGGDRGAYQAQGALPAGEENRRIQVETTNAGDAGIRKTEGGNKEKGRKGEGERRRGGQEEEKGRT